MDGKLVGPEALRPTSVLPWARAFALAKHQFWDPDFQIWGVDWWVKNLYGELVEKEQSTPSHTKVGGGGGGFIATRLVPPVAVLIL